MKRLPGISNGSTARRLFPLSAATLTTSSSRSRRMRLTRSSNEFAPRLPARAIVNATSECIYANQLVPIYQVSHASLVFHADTILFRLDVTSSRIQPARCHIEPVGSEVEDHLIRSGPTVRTQPDGHIADNENAHTSPGLGRPKAGQDHHRERATEPHHRLVP